MYLSFIRLLFTSLSTSLVLPPLSFSLLLLFYHVPLPFLPVSPYPFPSSPFPSLPFLYSPLFLTPCSLSSLLPISLPLLSPNPTFLLFYPFRPHSAFLIPLLPFSSFPPFFLPLFPHSSLLPFPSFPIPHLFPFPHFLLPSLHLLPPSLPISSSLPSSPPPSIPPPRHRSESNRPQILHNEHPSFRC